MTDYTINIKGKKANIRLFTNFSFKNRKKLIKSIVENIPYKKTIGFAGFKNKEILQQHLEYCIKDLGKNMDLTNLSSRTEDIISLIKNSIKKCLLEIKSENLEIFVFPTFDSFVKEKMNSVLGYCPWKNTILIYIYVNPTDYWKTSLIETIYHEFAHSVSLNHYDIQTLLDNLVFEGVAEQFKDHVTKDKKSPWVKSITKKEAFAILKKLKDKLNTSNDVLYHELFFGTGKYKLWSGYAIGYYLVEEYLKQQKEIDWNKLLATKSTEIFRGSSLG